MGVHGLTTYLREHYSIAKTLQFSANYDSSVSFVIDGWSFIYEALAQSDLPWVYGGEYKRFSELIQKIVRAWLAMGLRLYFVFDGPFPELKFPTITSRRLENNIKPSLLFFRTSSVSRSRPKFLRETAMLPPRAYTTCIQTLRNLQQSIIESDLIELHFADEEGDPYAVELAARLGGYVVGKDSDFVILNAEGYRGYVSFDDMIWSLASTEEDYAFGDDWGDNDGFQRVVNSKSKKKAATQQYLGQGIIPPDRTNDDTLELSVSVYSPSDLATHLQIPLSLLPLLAALVGNDFTGTRQDVSSATTSQQTNLQWLFFERQLTLSQRITRVAVTLRNILNAAFTASSGKKAKGRDKSQVHSVMDLIDRAVTALVVRNLDTIASGEKERVVERIVEATLQYAIPKFEGESGSEWTSDVCPLHEPDACPLALLRVPFNVHPSLGSPLPISIPTSPTGAVADDVHSSPQQLTESAALYVSAYRSGYLDPHTLDVLHSGTFWYYPFLENPDLEAVAQVFARPIQLWTYAILDEAVGIPERILSVTEGQKAVTVDSDTANEDEGEDEDEDELVDVVEDSETEEEDPLAPLRGALQQLNGSSSQLKLDVGDDVSLTSSQKRDATSRQERKPKKLVEEHLRRGTRLAAENVEVPILAELLGKTLDDVSTLCLPARSQIERLSVLLYVLGNSKDQVSALLSLLLALPSEQRVPALTLRWVLSRLRLRAQESGGNKDREKEKWTKPEAQAFLTSFEWTSPPHSLAEGELSVPIVDRNVQLTAQALVTMDALERLSEVLLLAAPGSQDQPAVLPSPSLLFSGRRFHAYLTGTTPIPTKIPADTLWRVSCEGLDDVFSDVGGKKRNKDKQSLNGSAHGSPTQARGGQKAARGQLVAIGGKFGLLAGLSVDD